MLFRNLFHEKIFIFDNLKIMNASTPKQMLQLYFLSFKINKINNAYEEISWDTLYVYIYVYIVTYKIDERTCFWDWALFQLLTLDDDILFQHPHVYPYP